MTDPFSKPSIRRRNGQQAACEPCRKAKLKCDHGSPVCSRCRKRRRPDRCLVLAAPMVRTAASHRIESSSVASEREEFSPRTSSIAKSSSEVSGFLGPTSFSATVQQDTFDDPKAGSDPKADDMDVAKPDQLRLGVQVLMKLPTEDTCHNLLNWYLDNVLVVASHRLTRRLTLNAFWQSYGHVLRDQRNKTGMESIAKDLLRNGCLPLKQVDDAMEWIASFSGFNTRWEVLGLLYMAFAYAILSCPDHILTATFGGKKEDRNGIVADMKNCVETCIDLCRESFNHLVCNLQYWNALLETVLSGDSSLSAWRLHNDAVGTSVAFGIHIYQGSSKITLQSEQTKTMSVCIFWIDKESAMFTGRPPSLSQRYYSCRPPLDINDDTLICGGVELEREIESLDENGWNTQGRVFDSTIVRMMLVTAIAHEEIMEIFLGNQAQFSVQRLNDLKFRTNDTFAKLPRHLQVSKADLDACKDDKLLWRLMMMRFERLRIDFLLERLSTEKAGESKRNLFKVARDMLDLVVFLWLQRDRFGNMKHDYDFVIICYGIPSVGILCTELMRQEKNPAEVLEVGLPRSQIVQNLSMMVGFLEWVRPAAGNYKLCCRMARVIRRVIDHLFEPVVEGGVDHGQISSEIENEFLPVDGLDDLDWLNSLDWSRGPFAIGDVDWLPNVDFTQSLVSGL